MFPLVLQAAETSRRGKRLIGPIDLSLEGHGVTVVIGPNGAGKTTLLRLMHGTARLNKGSVQWACDTAKAREAQAFVFQRPVMLRRTVRENLMYPLRLKGARKTDAHARAETAARAVGLEDFLERSAVVLSGGEQQKLAIARALITKPALVFLDEPTSSLDGRATRDIEGILQEAKAAGTRLIMSTHDMGQARRIADDVVFLVNGSVGEQDAASTFFDSPKTEQARAFLRGDIIA
ncbi:ATP-binding cassette domain-containing protein [Nereida sp. MMG025]|uniref:ATP-binding cassette domain-containing protein n=1 Tax=Nereida sp. MMG025 TaxID=2909981 RepID=UPI001F011F29|nr:ATP-binding cassette domain-containing protein [Nereida sp. MMG025]MCF6444241.1 ATP-binding cassette domain-containing protein [Nereida sp. MMG025]